MWYGLGQSEAMAQSIPQVLSTIYMYSYIHTYIYIYIHTYIIYIYIYTRRSSRRRARCRTSSPGFSGGVGWGVEVRQGWVGAGQRRWGGVDREGGSGRIGLLKSGCGSQADSTDRWSRRGYREGGMNAYTGSGKGTNACSCEHKRGRRPNMLCSLRRLPMSGPELSFFVLSAS